MESKKIKESNNNKKKYLLMSILYFICSLLWIIDGIICIKNDLKDIMGYVDIGLSAVLIMMGFIYYNKVRKL